MANSVCHTQGHEFSEAQQSNSRCPVCSDVNQPSTIFDTEPSRCYRCVCAAGEPDDCSQSLCRRGSQRSQDQGGGRVLIELIDDVTPGRRSILDHILVYDVSRWGRFQDVDESAHYEFVCKQNGIKVVYCAEQFDNDGSLMSSIVKNIKRVMAAEFSRELSVKVHAGHCRIASLGFRVGGPVAFGFRRELIDENKRSKGWLRRGERKSLQTDRVLLRLGSPEDATIVRWIFHQFVIERKSDTEIARQLNRANISNHGARQWTGS